MKQATPNHVGTQIELANILGVHRETLKRWLKEPGNPGTKADGRYPVKAWQEWVAANLKKAPTKSATEWKAKLTEMQAKKEEFKLGVLKGNHVSRALVDATVAELGSALKTIITTLHLLAPSLAGMEIPAIEKILREKEDEMMLKVHHAPDEVEAAVNKNRAELFDDEEVAA